MNGPGGFLSPGSIHGLNRLAFDAGQQKGRLIVRIGSTSNSLFLSAGIQSTSRAISRALERLSSGKRVLSPKDDAASFGQGLQLESQVRGLRQGIMNFNDQASAVDRASQGLQEQMDLVQAMRDLAVQGSSESLSKAERDELNSQLASLLSDYRRISSDTQYRGRKLLDGTYESRGEIDIDLGSSESSEVFQTKVGSLNFKSAGNLNYYDPFGGGLADTAVAADFSGDGITDYIYGVYDSEGALEKAYTYYEGTASGTFLMKSTFFLPYTASANGAAEAADMDGDGDLDFVIGDSTLGVGYFAFNPETKIFDDVTATIDAGTYAGIYGSTMKTGDFNEDGLNDYVLLRDVAGNNYAQIFLNDGTGNVTAGAQVEFRKTGSGTDLEIGDFNNDGHLDVLGAFSGTVGVAFGSGSGTFLSISTSAKGTSVAMAVGDVNNDGDLDYVLTDSATNVIGVYSNNGAGSFTAGSMNVNVGVGTSAPILVDIDGDNILDLKWNNLNAPYVALGRGDGTFRVIATTSSFAIGAAPVHIDLNGDGVPDEFSNNMLLIQGTKEVTGESKLTLASAAKASEALEVLDQALEKIKSRLGDVGALHSRLDFAAAQNLLLSESLSDAKDQLLNADMILETAELARLQILQQAQVAVKAQANVDAQKVLMLLGGL